MQIQYVPIEEIRRIREIYDMFLRLSLLADVNVLNTISMIMEAGSGHIGTSLSSRHIVTILHEKIMEENDIYFSSKGHDVPMLYAQLIAQEKLPFESIHTLRKLGGLPGHPDINTPFMVTNTGSLGMGISKARGMALADRLNGINRHYFVLTGDGELQEGQIWESLGQTANHGFSEITVIVDHNKYQSDTRVSKVSDIGDLHKKFSSFGWITAECNGHSFLSLMKITNLMEKGHQDNLPQVLIANTVKGEGVSFMEKEGSDGMYHFHSGALAPSLYETAVCEIVDRINSNLSELELAPINLLSTIVQKRISLTRSENVVSAYGDQLLALGKEKDDIVVLDADLKGDCGITPFEKEFPERFFECGIAEQDMVSMAGGLALSGKLPIVHGYACFWAARALEQIYNNSTEGKKIIYVSSMSGLLPATPGHSHQGVHDIASLSAMPGMIIIQPSNEAETRSALNWAVCENTGQTYIRLITMPYEVHPAISDARTTSLTRGRGYVVRNGNKAAIVAYGSVLLTEALRAADELEKSGVLVSVINFPWLNYVDVKWLEILIGSYNYPLVVTLDDHFTIGGMGRMLGSAIAGMSEPRRPKVVTLGIDRIPECGQNDEVIWAHNLDANSIVSEIELQLSLCE
jgi:transketolase